MNAEQAGKGLVPPGAPRWVTAELIDRTIRVWQPYYSKKLTRQDALAMVMNVSELLEVLHSDRVPLDPLTARKRIASR